MQEARESREIKGTCLFRLSLHHPYITIDFRIEGAGLSAAHLAQHKAHDLLVIDLLQRGW